MIAFTLAILLVASARAEPKELERLLHDGDWIR